MGQSARRTVTATRPMIPAQTPNRYNQMTGTPATRPPRSNTAISGGTSRRNPDAALPSVAGGEVKLADLSDPVLLVAFLSNHCPFVRHIESALAGLVVEYTGHGLAAVGVASNDVGISPTDDLTGLAGQVKRAG